MPKLVMHLPECEPEQHPAWRRSTYQEAEGHGQALAALCEQTRYMDGELYPDEPVWVEEVPDQPGVADLAGELAAALTEAKTRWGGDDVIYDQALARLFRAAGDLLQALPPDNRP